MKRTKNKWDKSGMDFDEYASPLDEVDDEIRDYMGGVVAPLFSSPNFLQVGECSREKDGIRYHPTFTTINNRHYYLGDMPAFENT